MFKEALPQMLQVMEDLKKIPGYKDLPEFQKVAAPFENLLREFGGKNY